MCHRLSAWHIKHNGVKKKKKKNLSWLRVHHNRLHPWWTVYPSKQQWLDLITCICIFPNRGGVSRQEARTQTLFHIGAITPLLWRGCITTAAKRWTQMTFEMSFPQMTHDSLSAVKIKQTLYGSHHAARMGNKERKWGFCVHVCVFLHMCKERSLLSGMF